MKKKERHFSNKSSWNVHLFLFSLLLLSLLASIPSVNVVNGDNLNPGIYSTDSQPYGISYQQWTARFWQWLYSLPSDEHPRDDYAPEKCANGQEGPVWFLDAPLGGMQERTCIVPAGKSILAAVLNGQCDSGDSSLRTDADIRKCATEGNDYGVISGTLDGVGIKNFDQYRIDSGFYNITHTTDNIYGQPAGGPFRAFTNGYFVFLEPPAPGVHDLHLTATVANPLDEKFNYFAEWTYHLIVK